jgi:putative transposase
MAATLGAEEITAATPATAPSSVIVTRTLRLKVRPESYRWLEAAAIEVNQVWNWCNETSARAARRYVGKGKWLSGFDLCKLSAGATQCFEHIGADTIQRVNLEYALRRRQFRKVKLRFRISRGARRSLGWVPFKMASLKRRGKAVRFCGKSFRLFEAERLKGVRWQQGCFAQDAVGDWWLCLPVEYTAERSVASDEAVGIDLGLKAIATTSDGATLDAGRWTERYAGQLATAQRRGHKRQAKRLHRRIARCRADALHKFSRKMIDRYQTIVVGDVSSTQWVKTRMAKSVLDAGWGRLRQMLQYKGEHAGRSVQIVNERFTTRACSSCGRLTGPSGPGALVVRRWCCTACGAAHDRDINAARNILARSRCRTAVCGNESSSLPVQPRRAPRARTARTEPASSAA